MSLDLNSQEAIQRIFKLDRYQAEYILYLRSRRRWTIPLENELLRKLRSGEHVNICEFGCNEETGERLLEDALAQLDYKLDPALNAKAHKNNLKFLSLRPEELNGTGAKKEETK